MTTPLSRLDPAAERGDVLDAPSGTGAARSEGIPERVGARPLTASAAAEPIKGGQESRTRTHEPVARHFG